MTEQTKQITFEGNTYTVPVWVKWVARDESGQICGYDLAPERFWDGFMHPSGGKWISIYNPSDWRDSLTEV